MKRMPKVPFADRVSRFNEMVTKTPGCCWEWQGSRHVFGYGSLCFESRPQLAHRFSYETFKGKIPPGLFVRHKCDNRPCVNPDHLELGTHADNMRDEVERGRSPRGERNPNAKLTEAAIREIRAMRNAGLTYGKIASHFNVNQATVGKIVNGERWTARGEPSTPPPPMARKMESL